MTSCYCLGVFIRETNTVNKKTGASYSKYQLVESYRNEKGPRQRIVMTLGELELDKSLWPALAYAIAERRSGVTSLFESDPLIARYADLAIRACRRGAGISSRPKV